MLARGELVADRSGAAFREQARPVEVHELLLDKAAHEARLCSVFDVPVLTGFTQQGKELLIVRLLAVVRGRCHQRQIRTASRTALPNSNRLDSMTLLPQVRADSLCASSKIARS